MELSNGKYQEKEREDQDKAKWLLMLYWSGNSDMQQQVCIINQMVIAEA